MSRSASTRTHSVVEPHPSVVKSSSGYIGSGRGGAGNFQRYQSSALSSGPNASGPAALTPNLGSTPKPRVMPAGRGGAGNMFRSGSSAHEEPNIFQFDEELIKRRESAAPVYHIGRGGAANWGGFLDGGTEGELGFECVGLFGWEFREGGAEEFGGLLGGCRGG
ncbi:hypothetical protein LTR91_021315 [Friedmanniomyces endolithicus]|uniref:Uncharacterized protein n=1 Tax=Friedmanniomyces endolithicus TaxID=329885 RepID=A0AAN6HAF5_9PEZI|nr:hypothetical protein LTR57_023560 [Friedmanniomyces endolithicus]KAK0955190.1 hypothetical protein LTS01_023518 [Friedmanniomyces endolithicus]KAK0958514.1 hypothetical protein LTR91_021315 [Friedmanniomyces endolithicus]KAK1025429.1 hypothetical protein LTS16_023207 [Friedmanniomyces endolithicus]